MNRGDKQSPNGGPIDGPLAAIRKLPVTSTNGTMGSAKDGAHRGTALPRSLRKQLVQRADVGALSERLSERDWAILQSVSEHKFLTTRHIAAFHFAGHSPAAHDRVARRVLARLRRLRLLGTLERQIGGLGAGSEGLVYYVDVVGDQLLRGRSGRRARRFHEPSRRFVRHQLAIADARLALMDAGRHQHLEVVVCDVEPASWRRYAGHGGAVLSLKADLYVETAVTPGSELVHPWFIEVDLGTETIPTLLKKCRDYESYRRTGTEQADGGGFPLVVWSVSHPDPARAERRRLGLREAIDSDRTLHGALFRIIAPDQLVPLLRAGGQP